MITKAQIKFVKSLQQKKFRDESGCFVAEGDKLINELREAFELELLITPETASTKEIEQMSGMRTPQGSIAVFKKAQPIIPPHGGTFRSLERSGKRTGRGLVLLLDGIQDPGNLGTIIRTADWFGIHDIICSPNTADCYNPKVVQATMGALARVQIHYTDLPEWMSQQPKDTPIYGTLLDGEDIYHTNLTPHGVIIMGNEGNGISEEVKAHINRKITIPSYADGHVESLNVAIATAITLAEFRRR